jgi:hypothetical protein
LAINIIHTKADVSLKFRILVHFDNNR